MAYYGWGRYVSVAERREKAERELKKMRGKGKCIQPVRIEGREIARTFWGKAWCSHLEGFSDFENRLPRGRTYVRNGSVCHLEIHPTEVMARVSGSRLYTVNIDIAPLKPATWKLIKTRCTGGIASILDLLQGRLSEGVMSVVTDTEKGLFPLPGEIAMRCTCPDWATMCKHVAAVLYGIGARLDESPELLFLLRDVNHEELIGTKAEAAVEAVLQGGKRRRVTADLEEIFGVEMEGAPVPSTGARKTANVKTVGAPTQEERKPAARPSLGARKARAKTPATAARTPAAGVKAQPLGARKTARVPARSPSARKARQARPTTRAQTDEREMYTEFPAEITGRHIGSMRQRMGLSQKELAALLGVSAAAVSIWEKSISPLRLQIRTRSALEREWRRSWG